MGRLFGTDGVRGIANEDLSAELAFKLGRSGAALLTSPDKKGKIVVGKDTRISGDLLEAALTAGICSAGCDVLKVGVLPTPAIAYLIEALGAEAGVVISASHNPAEYNGIKFFDGQGMKLADEMEDKIAAGLEERSSKRPAGRDVGVANQVKDSLERYINHVVTTIPADLGGFKVAIDCAHGAAYLTSPMALKQLGAQVLAVNTEPNGFNINDGCGSTHPGYIQEIVKSHHVDLGLTHDGDADRIIAVDESGEIVDGDFIMAICAVRLKERGLLKKNSVVATVMANLGFDLAMREHDIEVVKTKVGDRYVLEEMLKCGINMGGEQSGHIIFLEHGRTGDGLVTALHLMAAMRDKEKKLSELKQVMKKLPQVLLNVGVVDKKKLAGSKKVWEAVKKAERKLEGRGRILVRPSGTEPLVRVMVESKTEEEANSVAEDIAGIIEKELK